MTCNASSRRWYLASDSLIVRPLGLFVNTDIGEVMLRIIHSNRLTAKAKKADPVMESTFDGYVNVG
jgi:hypothetical protein